MIKNIEAYDMVRDYLTQNETWKDEEVADNLRGELIAHSTEATFVWGEGNTIESAATQLDTMPDDYTTDANFVAIEHDGTWLAVSTLEVAAMYISTIFQYMEREETWEKERADYIAKIESLHEQISTREGKGL